MSEKDFDWKIAYPGAEVPLPNGVKLHVYPIGVEHLSRFKNETVEMLRVWIANLKRTEDRQLQKIYNFEQLVPFLCGKGFEMLSACCVPPLKGAPLPVIPLAAKACLEETFTEGCLIPFAQAARKIAANLTGRPTSILELFLILSSLAATALKPSSTTGNAGSAAENSPTADTPSPSSSPGAAPGKPPGAGSSPT